MRNGIFRNPLDLICGFLVFLKFKWHNLNEQENQSIYFREQKDINIEQGAAISGRGPGPPLARYRPGHSENYNICVAHTKTQLPRMLPFPRYGYL